MRISDWSSDVCSSDLSHVSHEPFDGYYGPDVNTADLLEQRLNDPSSGIDAPAAIVVETVQGEGGLNVASPEWLRQIARIAKEQGALLIIDDIQEIGRASCRERVCQYV